MTQYKHVYWTYSREYLGSKDFIDPRVPLVRHTGWKKTNREFTEYPLPEPDNYNRAIVTVRPSECNLIEDQVIYFDSLRKLWITLMYVPNCQLEEIDLWIKSSDKLAVWCHHKPPHLKQHRTLLWARENISSGNMTENERLYTMGYYNELKVKYFSDDVEYIDSLLGTARAVLSDPIPEELEDTDYCDN